jgi:hypothetical protein
VASRHQKIKKHSSGHDRADSRCKDFLAGDDRGRESSFFTCKRLFSFILSLLIYDCILLGITFIIKRLICMYKCRSSPCHSNCILFKISLQPQKRPQPSCSCYCRRAGTRIYAIIDSPHHPSITNDSRGSTTRAISRQGHR